MFSLEDIDDGLDEDAKTSMLITFTPTSKEALQRWIETMLLQFGLNANLNNVNLQFVTNLDNLFTAIRSDLRKDLNPDVSSWNVSKVTSMKGMFEGCNKFSQDLSSWDVSNVTNMSNMFAYCRNFNSDLSDWDVSSVINMDNMFLMCENFNKPLKWSQKIKNVKNMSFMFADCAAFDQDIHEWNIFNVTETSYMFLMCPISNEHLPVVISPMDIDQ